MAARSETVSETFLGEQVTRRGTIFRFLHVRWRLCEGDGRLHDSLVIRELRPDGRRHDTTIAYTLVPILQDAIDAFEDRTRRPSEAAE